MIFGRTSQTRKSLTLNTRYDWNIKLHKWDKLTQLWISPELANPSARIMMSRYSSDRIKKASEAAVSKLRSRNRLLYLFKFNYSVGGVSLVLFWFFCRIAREDLIYDELESDIYSASAEFGDDDIQAHV